MMPIPSGLGDRTDALTDTREVMSSRRRLFKYGPIIVWAATFLLGSLPFVTLSLATNSFWPDSAVDFPLSLIPSVLIGDSVFLPLFNAVVFRIVSRDVVKRALLSLAIATKLYPCLSF